MYSRYTFWKFLYEQASKNYSDEEQEKFFDALEELSHEESYLTTLGKATKTSMKNIKKYHSEMLSVFKWMSSQLLHNICEEAYQKAFSDTSIILAEEVYCVCDMLGRCDYFPHDMKNDDFIKIYENANYNVSRCKWILYLCDIIKEKIVEDIRNNFIFNSFMLNSDIFKEMNLNVFIIKPIHFNSIKKQCNIFLDSKEDLNKKFFQFFCKDMPENVPLLCKDSSTLAIQCFFMYFYLTENMYADRGVELLDTIFSKAGLDSGMRRLPYVENAITFSIAKNNHSFDEWISAQRNWLEIKTQYTASLQLGSIINENPILEYENECTKKKSNYRQRTFVFYDEWVEKIITPGLETNENMQATQNSLNKIFVGMKNWENEQVRNFIIQDILNTELRRRWYFCRIINLIIEQQIKGIKGLDYVREIPAPVETRWLDDHNQIIINKIVKAFNFCFDGANIEDNQSEGLAFGVLTQRKQQYNAPHDKQKDGTERPMTHEISDLIRQTDSGKNGKKRKVGRKLLLMTVLLSKVYGVEEIDLNYVTTHILFNSRYGIEINSENNDFDKFFLDTYNKLEKTTVFQDRIRVLRNCSADFECKYVKKDKKNQNGKESKAVLHDYFLGKE